MIAFFEHRIFGDDIRFHGPIEPGTWVTDDALAVDSRFGLVIGVSSPVPGRPGRVQVMWCGEERKK